jgi:hypothetical protein
MVDDEIIRGYQRLEMDFFRLCKIRKIKLAAMLLFIYLRGLYCRFGKPIFSCSDSIISKHLGLSKNTLINAKEKLQERGLIEYKTFQGGGRATEYKILKTELAPNLKLPKIDTSNYQKMVVELPKNGSSNIIVSKSNNKVSKKPSFKSLVFKDKNHYKQELLKKQEEYFRSL